MTETPGRLPPQFWSEPAVAAALAGCDIPVILAEVRRAHGWTQAQLAEAVGYSQSWVSKVLRGRQPLTLDQVREMSSRIGVPLHLLRFGVRGDDDQTKRRDFGKAVALTALAGLAPSRPAEVDEGAVQTLTGITGAQRRLEATTPARDLARGATAHVELARRLLGRAHPGLAGDVRAALSEAAGFAAWVHADMQDHGSARGYYRLAVESARRAGHPLLAAYMIGSLAAFEIDADDAGLALTLLAQARRELGERPPATARAWLSSIEALGHAAAGDAPSALAALRDAESAVAAAERAATPPWPWVFPFDQAKLASYRALVAVRLGRAEEAEHALAESLASAQPAVKQRAVLTTEIAAARLMAGRPDEAFHLAGGALEVGLAYGSARIVHRVRRFRRAYDGAETAVVRDFDERLRSTVWNA
ncbi:helix-turn-helix domain-containing protein [Nonomuraea pusilla]|uniref:Helix-turn-helix domain-containing protein n=1 Tax=Nonomuraea pusilla TaxID=46177 RepID=A0A1H8APL9_9ACTN|nr:helix-turn-helix transcriptional regulator [Nonomuraea pusilla]SEM72513.1 Helix-turn-helix domain-containing protein [Nonomuraea pusilla]